MNADSTITILVSRSRALFRAAIWGVPAVLLGVACVSIYGRLHFIPSGISNRFVDYAFAIAAAPLPLMGLWTALKSIRWFMLFAWGGAIEIVAGPTSIDFRLGSFGRKVFQVADLDIRYPFELIDEDEGSFESFLPEEQQRATLLPRIIHPNIKSPLQRAILQFAVGDEAQVARALRPMIERWQAARGPTLASIPSTRDTRR